ncbi:MAG: hypothetical protein LBR07_08020 [Puniceicoccales bacterium]|jgi:hypothetical protein|nr:hypothetical protein [Puniceicoccales bacterium]
MSSFKRTKKKKFNPILLAFIVPILLVGAMMAVVLGGGGGGIRARPLDPVGDYTGGDFTNWRSRDGNRFSVRCEIKIQLGYDKEKGRILAITPKDKTGMAQRPLVVFVPLPLSDDPLFESVAAGQNFTLLVRVQGDLLVVQKAEKS